MTDDQRTTHEFYEHTKRVIKKQMKRDGVSMTMLAQRMHRSEGRVRQILAPYTNLTLEVIAQVGLALGTMPRLTFKPVERPVVQQEDGDNQ